MPNNTLFELRRSFDGRRAANLSLFNVRRPLNPLEPAETASFDYRGSVAARLLSHTPGAHRVTGFTRLDTRLERPTTAARQRLLVRALPPNNGDRLDFDILTAPLDPDFLPLGAIGIARFGAFNAFHRLVRDGASAALAALLIVSCESGCGGAGKKHGKKQSTHGQPRHLHP